MLTSDQVDAAITDMLDRMQANEIIVHRKLFFIPNPNLPLLNVLEDYIDAISQHNLSDGLVMSNSMFFVDAVCCINKIFLIAIKMA